MDTAFNADHVFAALADATRRDIVLRALSGSEGVAELAGHYPMSFAAVQKHVAVLERAGLVTKERTGRRKVVRTNIEGLRLARSLLDQYEALWRGRIDRMTDLITSSEGGTRMTVTAVRKDPEALTMTLTAEFDASPERVWDLWADPRQLERWWGPPTWPATFTAHDLAPGGHVEYHMTGPTGDEAHGFWDIVEVDPPRRLVFLDGFANDDGTPNDDFPRNEGRVTIEPIDAGRTRMSIESRFPSTEAMEQVLAMGMEEGLTQAVGQIDAILAEDPVPRPSGDAHVKEFEPLVGEWHGEGAIPTEPPMQLSVEANVERLGAFIVFSSAGEPAELPDSLSIIGGAPDGDAQPMHYFDERGVERLYLTALEGSTWKIWRAPGEAWNGPHGPGFNQRFIGEISPDGNTIEGRWERGVGDAGDAWEIDFPLRYVRK